MEGGQVHTDLEDLISQRMKEMNMKPGGAATEQTSSVNVDFYIERTRQFRDKLNAMRKQLGQPPLPDGDMTLDTAKSAGVFSQSGISGPTQANPDSASASDEQVCVDIIVFGFVL